jgi:hypothetical protein
MRNKNFIIGLCGATILAGFTLMHIFLSGYASPTWAANGVLLGDKHKNLGITCDGCHQENPPKENVPTSMCMNCHGDSAKLAQKTLSNKNPHEAHVGELDCDKCHHSHKPSGSYCDKCHEFGFKVP